MSAFNRRDDKDRMAQFRDKLHAWQPNEIDRKLSDPVGEAFTREALHDFFRWAPDRFEDHILGNLVLSSWLLSELAREVGEEHGFQGGTGVLSGSWRRVIPAPFGCVQDFNPGLRTALRSEGESVVIVNSDNRYIRAVVPDPKPEKPTRSTRPENAADGIAN